MEWLTALLAALLFALFCLVSVTMSREDVWFPGEDEEDL